jgi:hypothetical protein
MTSIAAGARIGEPLSGQLGEAERIIEVSKGGQPGIGRDPRSLERQPEATIERHPKTGLWSFTRHLVHSRTSR